MRLPSWDEFNQKLTELDRRVSEATDKFKNNYPLLNSAITGLLPLLPPPLDSVAERNYDSFDGSEEEKSEEVLRYFRYLQSQGKRHYERIATRLDNVVTQINDLTQLTAKESTVQTIQEILISSGKVVDENLGLLNIEFKRMDQKIDRIEESAHESYQLLKAINAKFDRLGITAEIGRDREIIVTNEQLVAIESLKEELQTSNQSPELDIDFFLKEANAHYYAEQYEKAIQLYDRISESHRFDVTSLNNKGSALFGLGRYEEALTWYDKALEVDPKHAYALNNKGSTLSRLGRNQEALIWLTRLWKLIRRNPMR